MELLDERIDEGAELIRPVFHLEIVATGSVFPVVP